MTEANNIVDPSQTNDQETSLSSHKGKETVLNTGVLEDLFILFGVKGRRRTLELAQLNSKQYTDDGSFFDDLKKSYKELRGFWRYWFSVWRLSYCDFVKVRYALQKSPFFL